MLPSLGYTTRAWVVTIRTSRRRITAAAATTRKQSSNIWSNVKAISSGVSLLLAKEIRLVLALLYSSFGMDPPRHCRRVSLGMSLVQKDCYSQIQESHQYGDRKKEQGFHDRLDVIIKYGVIVSRPNANRKSTRSKKVNALEWRYSTHTWYCTVYCTCTVLELYFYRYCTYLLVLVRTVHVQSSLEQVRYTYQGTWYGTVTSPVGKFILAKTQ